MKNFYEKFVGVPSDKLEKVAQEGYRAMTAVICLQFFNAALQCNNCFFFFLHVCYSTPTSPPWSSTGLGPYLSYHTLSSQTLRFPIKWTFITLLLPSIASGTWRCDSEPGATMVDALVDTLITLYTLLLDLLLLYFIFPICTLISLTSHHQGCQLPQCNNCLLM